VIAFSLSQESDESFGLLNTIVGDLKVLGSVHDLDGSNFF